MHIRYVQCVIRSLWILMAFQKVLHRQGRDEKRVLSLNYKLHILLSSFYVRWPDVLIAKSWLFPKQVGTTCCRGMVSRVPAFQSGATELNSRRDQKFLFLRLKQFVVPMKAQSHLWLWHFGSYWGMGMLSSCIYSTLVSECAMKGIPIEPLAQWGKELAYCTTSLLSFA